MRNKSTGRRPFFCWRFSRFRQRPHCTVRAPNVRKNSTGRTPLCVFGFRGSVNDRIVQLEPQMRVKTAQDPGHLLLGGFCGSVNDRNAKQCNAKQCSAKLCKAIPNIAMQTKAMQTQKQKQSKATQCKAKQQSKAMQSKAKQRRQSNAEEKRSKVK